MTGWLIAASMFVAATLLAVIAYRGARADIPVGSALGIRTPQTMASESAWVASHEMAARWFARAGWLLVVAAVVMMVCAVMAVQPAGLTMVALPIYAVATWLVVTGVRRAVAEAERVG